MGGGSIIDAIEDVLTPPDRPWQLSMSVHTGDGQEAYEFAILDFSPTRFRGLQHQEWCDQFNLIDNPRLLIDYIKVVGESHVLTIKKTRDICTYPLFKKYLEKKRLPSAFLTLKRHLRDGVRLTTQAASAMRRSHNAIFMPDALITYNRSHSSPVGFGDVAWFEYLTFKVKDAFFLSA